MKEKGGRSQGGGMINGDVQALDGSNELRTMPPRLLTAPDDFFMHLERPLKIEITWTDNFFGKPHYDVNLRSVQWFVLI